MTQTDNHCSGASLENGQGLALPAYQTEHAAGMDLLAAVGDPVVLGPMQRFRRPVRFRHGRLPPGYEAQIRPRSGLGAQTGSGDAQRARHHRRRLPRRNQSLLVINLGPDPITITRGMRIAPNGLVPARSSAARGTK